MARAATFIPERSLTRASVVVVGAFLAIVLVMQPLASAATVLGLALAVAGVLRPDWILNAMIATLPLQAVFVLTAGANFKISEVLGCVLIASVGIRCLIWDEPVIFQKRIAVPLIAFLGLVVLSTLNTPRFREAMTLNSYMLQSEGRDSPEARSYVTAAWGIYCVLLMAAVSATVNSGARLRRAFRLLALGAGAAAVLGVVQWVVLLQTGVSLTLPGSTQHLNVLHSVAGGFPRSPSTFTEPSVFAFFMVLFMPVTLALAVGSHTGILGRASATVLFLAQCLGLLLSFSVSGYVLFLVVLLVFTGMLLRRTEGGTHGLARKAIAAAVLMLVVVSLLQFVGVYPADVGEFVAQRLFGEADSAQIRFGLARVAWDLGSRHFLTGVGIGNYPFLALGDPAVRSVTGIELQVATPSNLYLLYLAELGVPGLLLFLWFARGVGRFLAESRRSIPGNYRALHAGLCASLSGALLSFVFLDNLFVNYLWVLLGLAAAMVRLAETPAHALPSGSGR